MATYHKKRRHTRALNKSGDLFETSKTLTNSFVNQFAPQTFDSKSFSPMNDINQSFSDKSFLANNIAEQEGWTPFCSIATMPQEDGMCVTSKQGKYIYEPNHKTLLSADIMPQFSTKHGYGSNDLYNANAINYKNELFTGNLSSKTRKQESEALFDVMPTKPATVGLTMPRDLDRISLSHYKNDVQLSQLQRDAPMDTNYRQREKTLEELYINPRQIIEGRYVHSGMRGTRRTLAPNSVETHKAEQYKTMSEDDLIPTKGSSIAPRVQDNFVMKIPHKDSQHREHMGHANMPTNATMTGKFAPSKRQNFLMPEHGHQYAHQETRYNPNQEAYELGATNKDMLVDNTRIGQISQDQRTYMSNNQPLGVTLKEQSIEGYSQHNVNAETKGMVYRQAPLATTLKEQIVDNALLPQINQQDRGMRIYQQEAVMPTLKEGLIETLQPANVYREGNYLSGNITVDTTMKELIDIDWRSFTQYNAPEQLGAMYSNQPVAVTLKEQTLETPHFKIQARTTQMPMHTSQPLDTTLKEQGLYAPQQTVQGQSHHTMRNNQAIDVTLKEQMIDAPQQQFITDVRTKIRAQNLQALDPTLKEQTVYGYDPRNVQGNGIYVNTNQPLAATTKDQTVDNKRSNNVQGSSKGLLHNTRPLDTTTKEMTIDNQHLGTANLDTTGRGYGYLAEIHDVETTIKETTIDQSYQGPLISDNHKNRVTQPYRDAEFRSIREQLQKYRNPTQNSVHVTVGPDSINAAFRDDNNTAPDPRMGVTYNPQQGRMKASMTVTDHTRSALDRFVNPALLSQFDINPYHIDPVPIR